MNFFLKIAKYLVFVLLVLFLIEAKASNDGSAGVGVPLAPLPTLPPFINEKPAVGDYKGSIRKYCKKLSFNG
jgi:hypothetical protein